MSGQARSDRARAVLVTGCSSGIGLAAAHSLHARGYRVLASARKPADVRALAARGLESLELDLDDSASIAAAVDTVLERTSGRLYGLFNNGGFGQPGALEDLSREVLRAQFETNVFGWHELTNAVLPAMRRAGEGRIVQNSSMLGLVALRFRGAYTASKFAVEALSDTLRMELAGSGIHVSLIEPGPITSRFGDNAVLAFRRNVDPSRSPFRAVYAKVERRMQAATPTPFTLPESAVVERLVHALESPRPRARYYVTFPTSLFATLRRILPGRALDAVLREISRRELKGYPGELVEK